MSQHSTVELSSEPRSPFSVALDGVDEHFHVLAFSADEQVNAPFRFEVRVVASHAIDPQHVLGAQGALINAVGGTDRITRGIVTACELGVQQTDGRSVLRLRLEPGLALLKHRSHWRIFHDEPIERVVEQLLAPLNLTYDWRVHRQRERKPHRCQRGERDLAFLHRMLSEEGVFYWYDHTRENECLVFADDVAHYSKLPHASTLSHVGLAESLTADDRSVWGLSANHRLRAGRQSHGYFDVLRPLRRAPDESVVNESEATGLDAYSHSAEGLVDWMAAKPDASQLLTQARVSHVQARAGSSCPHLAPGHIVTISDHPEDKLNSEYVILRVVHEGSSFANGDAGKRSYEATVELAPRGTPVLIEPPETRLAQGLETATVMGPESEEVYTDGFGRVQVRFHWDRGPGRHPPVTAWVRVAQSWGGAGYGATFTPRVGNEVLIGFMDGDPDRPIIVGSVHNALTPATPRFPAERTRNGISTRSSPNSGSGHCLMFEDKRGEELLELRSARTLVVAAAEDNLVTAGSRYELRVGTDYAERLGGAYESAVGGDASQEFGRDLRTRVAANEHRQVGGSAASTTEGSVEESVGGMVTTMIGSGRQVFVGGSTAANDSLVISGSYSIGARRGVRIQSPTSIELVVGESRLSILPDRILLESPTVQIQAEKAVRMAQGPDDEVAASLLLAGGASLSGGVATVASAQGGILALDAEAKLNGALVKLNCDSAEGAGAEKVIDETRTGSASFRVLPNGLPPGTTTVVLSLRLPSGDIEERECAVGGIVTVDGHPGEAVAVVGLKVAGASVAYTEAPQESEERNG